MKELIYIFLGGGTGSVLRYYVQELLHERIILLFLSLGNIYSQYLRQFSHRIVFMPFPPVLILTRNASVIDSRFLRWIHHFLLFPMMV